MMTAGHESQDRSGVARRRVLGTAGLGAAATAVPALLGATAASAAPASDGSGPASSVARPATSQLPLVGGAEFPIGIFWPPPPYQTSVERYQEIADAGVTFVISGNYADDGNIIKWLLSAADQTGLKVLVSDDTQIRNLTRWFTISDDRSVPMSITTADGRELVKRALDAYASHESLAGFNLFDEPWRGIFPSLGKAFAIVRSEAPQLLAYANLLPGTGAGYSSYVDGFVQAVTPSLLSFDRYPILSSGQDSGYFDNWARIRSAALKAGLPAWVFVQTLGYNGHRTPTAAELAWQVNISLAYGAKGIQYFTWWTPDPARGEGFQPAVITVDGHRTDRYQAVKRLNHGWLQPVGRQLKPLVSQTVQHANESPLPAGATGFTPDEYVSSVSGSAVVLGRFRPADTQDPSRLLLVVNRSGQAAAHASLRTGTAVGHAEVFQPRSGNYHALSDADTLSVDLDPGRAVLFRLS